MFTALQTFDLDTVRSATNFVSEYPFLHFLVYGVAEVLIFVFPAVLYYLWQKPHHRGHYGSRKAVVLAIMSIVAAFAVKGLVSFVWTRSRPFVTDPHLLFMPFNVDPASFPSGHTLLATTIAASLYFSGYRKVGAILMVCAVLVGLSRIAAGVHYPTDILAGLIIGISIAGYFHREASAIRRYLPDHSN
jgi:undecaprenyl-diphosphatase